MKKNQVGLIIVLLILFLWIVSSVIISSHPFLTLKCEVPEEYVNEIYSFSCHKYSNQLPLLPIRITIEKYEVEYNEIYFTVYYFPLGTVRKSYIPNEGFGVVEPLIGFL